MTALYTRNAAPKPVRKAARNLPQVCHPSLISCIYLQQKTAAQRFRAPLHLNALNELSFSLLKSASHWQQLTALLHCCRRLSASWMPRTSPTTTTSTYSTGHPPTRCDIPPDFPPLLCFGPPSHPPWKISESSRIGTSVDMASWRQVAIALGAAVYLWNAGTGDIEELCSTTETDDYITSLSWAADGAPHPAPSFRDMHASLSASGAHIQPYITSTCSTASLFGLLSCTSCFSTSEGPLTASVPVILHACLSATKDSGRCLLPRPPRSAPYYMGLPLRPV